MFSGNSWAQVTPDLATIEYPSDRLTVGQLRRLFPTAFDGDISHKGPSAHFAQFFANPNQKGHAKEVLGKNLLELERQIVYHAFRDALKPRISTPTDIISLRELRLASDYREQCENALIDAYTQLGIAPGEATAMELVRSLKEQGRSQAASRQLNSTP